MTHGHEQWCGDCLREWGVQGGGRKGEKIGTTVTASWVKYNEKKKALLDQYLDGSWPADKSLKKNKVCLLMK